MFLIDNAVGYLNSQKFLSMDLESRLLAHKNEIYLNQLYEYITTGQASAVPFQVYTVPMASGNLIISRNIL